MHRKELAQAEFGTRANSSLLVFLVSTQNRWQEPSIAGQQVRPILNSLGLRFVAGPKVHSDEAIPNQIEDRQIVCCGFGGQVLFFSVTAGWR